VPAAPHNAVHRHRAHRIVDFEFLVQKLDGHHDQHARHRADEGGAPGGHRVAAGGDGYQPAQRAV
jgi:hypothetical protein